MIWLLVVVSTVSVCECFLRMPFVLNIRSMILYSTKSYRAVSSNNISDHWKEKVLPVYSAKIFFTSLKLFLLLLAALLPLVMWQYLGALMELDLFASISGWPGMVGMTIAAAMYFFVREKILRG